MVLNDYHYYTDLMRNGFYDKLFFVDKIFHPWKSMLDFGAADGFTTKLIGKIFPDKHITGYDEDEKMIETAQYSGEGLANVEFTNSLDLCQDQEMIYLSSVIHEVYHYKTQDEIDQFWDLVFSENRKGVIIRDMVFNEKFGHAPVPQEILERVVEHAKQNQILHILEEFCNIFGNTLDDPKTMTHWLLKYSYMTGPNYSRELHENYLSFFVSELERRIPKDFKLMFLTVTQLAYLTNQWEKDFGNISVPWPTHGKFIIKRRNLQ